MYLVTGGAGFIGSAFLAELNARGVTDIVVVDQLDSSEKWKNLSSKRFVDYLHKDQLIERIEHNRPLPKFSALIHLGACSSTTERDAEYMMQNNYRFSRQLAEWALERKLRMIYASSAATYGNGDAGFSDDDETAKRLIPLNVYAFSKQMFDLWAIQT
ncbi:MAG TPA: NAD-dependent epimerase/dehydratase family protein, partial [Oligoflexia bacterium]|nr:NAD-dependent epimerase/dehydratase family protein [Oligoflexia bacterium]